MRAPPDGSVQRLQSSLGAKQYPAQLPVETQTLLLVITIPGPERGRPTVRALESGPGDLPPADLRPLRPRAVLEAPGLYAALLDAKGVVWYAAAVGDPRLVLHERADPSSGRWSGRAGTRPGGAIALRIPWIPGTKLAIFAVDDSGQVSEVLGELALPGKAPAKRWGGDLHPVELMQ